MDRGEAVHENPPGGTPPCPETQVVKEASTEQELGLSTSQEGAPQLLHKAWPLEIPQHQGLPGGDSQGPPAQPRKWAKRNQEALM